MMTSHKYNLKKDDVFQTRSRFLAFVIICMAVIHSVILLRKPLVGYVTMSNSKPPVPFALPGLKLAVRCAMDIDLPQQHAEIQFEKMMNKISTHRQQSTILWKPPRVLVAVTTSCCQQISVARRKAIRETWVAIMRETSVSKVDVLFFLAQPRNRSVFEEWVPIIEVREILGSEGSSTKSDVMHPLTSSQLPPHNFVGRNARQQRHCHSPRS